MCTSSDLGICILQKYRMYRIYIPAKTIESFGSIRSGALPLTSVVTYGLGSPEVMDLIL